MVLTYRHRSGDEWQDESYPVQLDATHCHLGGERQWFLALPMGCGRRVAVLYDSAHNSLVEHGHIQNAEEGIQLGKVGPPYENSRSIPVFDKSKLWQDQHFEKEKPGGAGIKAFELENFDKRVRRPRCAIY